MTDLIARLEAHIARADCVCVLRHDFPAILHALKVTKAAEEWHRCVKKGDGPAALKAYDALVAAVKGEQG